MVEEGDSVTDIGGAGIGVGFEDEGDVAVSVGGEARKVYISEGGHEVVGGWGFHIVDMEAGEPGAEAFEPAGGVDEAEVFSDLGMAEVAPEADAFFSEVLEELVGFEFGGDGFPGGEIFEGECDVGFCEDWGEGFEAFGEALELGWGAAVAEELEFIFDTLEIFGELLSVGGEAEEGTG